MASLYEAWRRWGEKPNALKDYDTLPEHFNPAIEAFNFLKRHRTFNETGLQPLDLSVVQLYICTILGYSDPCVIRWFLEVISACDEAERQVSRELIDSKKGV